MESKVRLLVAGLETHDSIYLAHPFNKGFERVHKCASEGEIDKVKGGSLAFQIKDIPTETTDAGAALKEEGVKVNADSKHSIVYTTTYYIGLELKEGRWFLVTELNLDQTLIFCLRA